MRFEDDDADQPTPGDVVDAVFAISCRSLPVDHAWALSQAVQAALPWFADEPQAGLHPIHGAASGSGWMRPEGPDAVLQLSHRAKLVLRLPEHRVDDAATLVGQTMEVAGSPLRIDALARRPLARITTLFSRGVILGSAPDEATFLAAAVDGLAALGIHSPRVLCGRVTSIATPDHVYEARSLMLAGLTLEQSFVLQRNGLGEERTLGCGLFIPHKDIADLRARSD